MLALSFFEDKDSFSVNPARPDLPKRKSDAKVLEERIVKHPHFVEQVHHTCLTNGVLPIPDIGGTYQNKIQYFL